MGSGKGPSASKEFPPRWVGNAIDRFLSLAHTAFVVGPICYLGIALYNFYCGAWSVDYAISRWADLEAEHIAIPATWILACFAGICAIALYFWRRRDPIYLLDFECYRPPDNMKVGYKAFMDGSTECGGFNADALDFQEKILYKSALSEDTFFPAGLHMDPPRASMALAREEAELVMFSAVADLLKRTRLHPRQIDVLVVNCSLFNPTPSLSAMIINHFKMRTDIESYNLGGMGCSAGIISIGLARKLLGSLGRGGYALVVSTENITQNWYRGNERSMLIPNTIFRMGAAAIMLTNKGTERRRSLYELQHLVRVHLGADNAAYRCVFQHADDAGVIGVELNRDLVKVAARAMEVNLTRLGPLVLPWGEKLAFAANWVARKGLKMPVAPYVPDFRKAFDHFCLHAGGRGVVEGLSAQLGLDDRQMAPSANTLYWYGNTSSSTVWYSFGFVESAQGVKRGGKVWQIGFGSGFKCNSAVWKALKTVKREHTSWIHLKGREHEALDKIKEISNVAKMEKKVTDAKENGVAHPNGVGGHANGTNGTNGTIPHMPSPTSNGLSMRLRSGKIAA